jgi:hypothetical protein
VDPIYPALLISGLAEHPDARRARISRHHRRTEREPASRRPDRGAPLPYRRVDYILPVPNDADRWLVWTFTALCPGDGPEDPSVTLAELFDGIMSTFRWVNA